MTQVNPFAVPEEAVPFGAPPEPEASPLGGTPRWRHRAGGALLDLFALSLFGAVVNGVLALLGAPGGEGWRSALAVLGFLAGLAAAVAYYGRQGRTGGSYAKDLLGLRVLDTRTGGPLGTVPGVLRPVAHLADTVFLVGFLRPLWHPQGKTFADSMQRSLVVRSEPRPTPLGSAPLRSVAVVAVLLYVALTGAALRVSHVHGVEHDRAEAGRGAAASTTLSVTGS